MDISRPYETEWRMVPRRYVAYRLGMSGFTFKRTVTVWDKLHPLTVHQESKTVWLAVGEYRGERLEVKGKTDTEAVALWRDAAKLKGR